MESPKGGGADVLRTEIDRLESEETKLKSIEEAICSKRQALTELHGELTRLEDERSSVAAMVQHMRGDLHGQLRAMAMGTLPIPLPSQPAPVPVPVPVPVPHPHPSHIAAADERIDALQTLLRLEQDKVEKYKVDAEEARALKGLLLQKRCYQCHEQMTCHCEGFPVLGVEVSEAKAFNLDGVWVVSVVDAGPGQQAGLAPGDVIYEWDGKPIASRADLRSSLSNCAPNQTVTISITRDPGNAAPFQHRLSVKLGSSRLRPQGIRPIKLSTNPAPQSPSRALMAF